MASPAVMTVATVIMATPVIVAMPTAIMAATPTAMIIPTVSAATEVEGYAVSPAIGRFFDRCGSRLGIQPCKDIADRRGVC